MAKLTHTSKSIAGQLEFYDDRAKNLDLIWCDQVLNLLNSDKSLLDKKSIKINDIGCNYFQFYKEIKRQNIENCYDYFGYDIDEHFIKLGLKYFPELDDRFQVSNVEEVMPRNGHVSIMSAILEHSENPYQLLGNVLKTTSNTVILRTFLGENEIIDLIESIDGEAVLSPYYINQFSLFKMINIFLEHGFTPTLHQDRATNHSAPYKITEPDMFRQMYILVGTKN
jgi:hypothetical protein